VALTLDGVLYLRIINPYKASYGVEDPEFAVTQLAQTTMRYGVDVLICSPKPTGRFSFELHIALYY